MVLKNFPALFPKQVVGGRHEQHSNQAVREGILKESPKATGQGGEFIELKSFLL